MREATYEDAILVARMLDLQREFVWSIIQGMRYRYHAELRIAVLNSGSGSRDMRPSARGFGA